MRASVVGLGSRVLGLGAHHTQHQTPSTQHLVAFLGSLLFVGAAACSDAGEPPTRLAAPDSADQVLYGMTHHVTIDGVLRAQLDADTAYVYQNAQTADLVGVRVEFLSPRGTVSSTITADSGMYDFRGRDMEARGNVVAVTPDGRRLTTSILRYNRRIEEISGPAPFVFDAPDRHLEGSAFTADPEFSNVRAVEPRRGRAEGVEVRRR